MTLYQRVFLGLLVGLTLLGISAVANSTNEAVVLRIYGPPLRQAVVRDTAVKSQAAGPLVASFGMEFIKSLPQHTFVAQTPWYKDPVKFTGPLLRDVLAAAKIKGNVVHAIALDDYRTTIPFSDLLDYDVTVAYKMNGETLTLKNKGPLFVVYPYDSKPGLQAVLYYERSIWQLKALIVE